MVRAPCCEKMGLKKGPWTPEEDQVLVSYIQKNGHGNWRALPKQAGLLRCGKSCRLRWTNYLRPDIKRGNFSKEEEETIIKLHEMLGNRWSAIAARLPGRTDNEIKNVWHTHLKKKLKNYQASQDTKRHSNIATKSESKTTAISPTTEPVINANFVPHQDVNSPVSPQYSSSELSSVTADSSAMTSVVNDHVVIKNEETDSFEYFPQIDESFWSEEILSADNENNQSAAEIDGMFSNNQVQFQFPLSPIAASGEDITAYTSRLDDGMNFWYDLFIRAGDLPELPEF